MTTYWRSLLVRGTFLRVADLRFRPAYISVAVRRSTIPRRGVPIMEPDHRPGELCRTTRNPC
jgi:hypothetical protein